MTPTDKAREWAIAACPVLGIDHIEDFEADQLARRLCLAELLAVAEAVEMHLTCEGDISWDALRTAHNALKSAEGRRGQ